jgi:4,5:9,10-diseco-3-hydroxy-5,9,17-trioxoandrosta-1(10),2-diene-4-oate hydrolase
VATTGAGSRRSDETPTRQDTWLEIDWRTHQRWLELDGRAVNAVDIGEGPPVVLVHGLGGNWQNWLEVLPALADAGHRAIAFDLPGFGHSEMPARDITIPRYGLAVDAVLEALGVEGPVAVVGSSMGGLIAADLAVSRPSTVERLVLVSAAALWNEQTRARPLVAASKVSRFYAPLLVSGWEIIARLPRLRHEALRAAGIRNPRRISAQLAYELLSGVGKPGFIDALQALYDYRIRDRLPEIACPTLIVWGGEDPVVPLRHAFEFERLIPGGRVVVFPGAGHAPMIELPERFNQVLLDFLRA